MPGPSPVGAALKRREDARLLVGRGRYLDDLRAPGLLHAVLVRSPHAHADILSLDATAARAVDGVVAVLTRAELPELAGSVPPLVPEPKRRAYQHPVLAAARVRHVGEAVAVVVATDVYRAADGAAAVHVEYAPLAAATDAATAVQGPIVQPDWPDNLFAATASAVGDVARGFKDAAVIEGVRLAYPRVSGTPIEPRGVLAQPDETGTGLTVWTSTQVPFGVRAAIAGVLGLPEERVRVLAPEIGGGFGVKGHVYPEDVMIPAVARHLGRPVKWVETRTEHMLTAAADRDQAHEARIGITREGTITAIETHFTRDHGAFPTLGEAITLNTINHLPGPYRVPNYRATADNVLTHKTFLAAYRGAGRPEAAFVLDRLLDRAARAAGLDPVEVRRRNLVPPSAMPYATGLSYRDGVPISYDPADYVTAFDRMIERFGYAEWRKQQATRRGSTRPIGIGVSAYVEGTGLGPFEGADVRVDPQGKVFVYLGVSQQGQGHETVFAQICAERLAVSPDDVMVVGGDTQLVGYGMGTIASRVAAVAGPAVAQAASDVATKARAVAAELFECAADDVVLREGHAEVRGAPDKRLPLGRLARAALRSRASASAGGVPGLSGCAFFYPGSVTWAFGGQAVAVEVDTETGVVTLLRCVAVHDCGRPINPMIVEGQLHGGIVQGIGSALREELVYDEAGQLLTATFMDYCPPRADEVPPLDVISLDFPSAVNPLGVKGVGESGIIAGAAAVGNAVEDALADRGAVVTRVPLTPSRVFELLHPRG
ncbi:MAG TPA: xanthine dehydrogenase family protein molybdopterin-binding subunit [Terriglobales bacterium]|nr:xanthine dehydrogenase family protein molybdopterin-binding subunit [Terriglobales bacterium]